MPFTTADFYESARPGDLASYEREDRKQPHWRVTWGEAKLLMIASTGFFIDAYDLFTINLVLPMLDYEYNRSKSSSIANAPLQGGVLKAAANLGCIPGQIIFGLLADVYGRKAIYGKELMVIILGTIMVISVPNYLPTKSIWTWITCFRVLMGIGIGGDYPMSASVVSDRSNLSRRGVMLSFIFAMQGWGNFIGGIVAIIVLVAFKPAIHGRHEYGEFDGAWRIITGIVLVPCFATLYQRLTLPESGRFKNVQALRDDPTLLNGPKKDVAPVAAKPSDEVEAEKGNANVNETAAAEEERGMGAKKALSKRSEAFREFAVYFSEWRHLKTLLGTTSCWFLLDIAFYGINLNQSIVIQAIGYNKATDPWEFMYKNTQANLIITAAGYLPGYYATMLTIEYLGRKNIQFFGFLLEALFLGIVAGDFKSLETKPGAFIVCFALLQFFFNFGANATTFIIPAEVFPTRVRAAAHGFSAACGKAGAVLASLGFAIWAKEIGTANVLWIFFAICLAGAACTLLLPETTDRDPDVCDLEERQAAAAAGGAAYSSGSINSAEK